MKQKPVPHAVIEFGYLVSAEGMRAPWKFWCIHCDCPMEIVPATDEVQAHFLHIVPELTERGLTICPYIPRPPKGEPTKRNT